MDKGRNQNQGDFSILLRRSRRSIRTEGKPQALSKKTRSFNRDMDAVKNSTMKNENI
jgi:hypothetical protein